MGGKVPEHAQPSREDILPAGRISGIYGVRGWVKVYSDTSPRENILNYSPWLLKIQGVWQERQVLNGRLHGKGVVAQIEGIEDRDQARLYMNTPIAIRLEQLPCLQEGEYYWRDLIGLDVVNLAGEALGQVDHLLETGANDVLVVKGEQEILIPFVLEQVVKQVDLKQGLITVDWLADY